MNTHGHTHIWTQRYIYSNAKYFAWTHVVNQLAYIIELIIYAKFLNMKLLNMDAQHSTRVLSNEKSVTVRWHFTRITLVTVLLQHSFCLFCLAHHMDDFGMIRHSVNHWLCNVNNAWIHTHGHTHKWTHTYIYSNAKYFAWTHIANQLAYIIELVYISS